MTEQKPTETAPPLPETVDPLTLKETEVWKHYLRKWLKEEAAAPGQKSQISR